MGHPSQIAQACDFRPGNRMTLSMLAPERHLILILTRHYPKFKPNFFVRQEKGPPIKLTEAGSGATGPATAGARHSATIRQLVILSIANAFD
jgi:hypothetical protein